MKFIFCLSLTFLLLSCDRAKSGAKTIINKSGEAIGQSASEFAEGVSEGVEKTLERDLVIAAKLKESGIETGKVLIENDSLGNTNNVLVVYTIFSQNFNGKITAKITDKVGRESGRSSQKVTAKAGEAKYLEFIFDRRTSIDVKSTIDLN